MSRAKLVKERIHIKGGYAKFCPADRNHGGHDIYLGTVVDESNGIFYNRNHGGLFRFTLEDGRTELNSDEIGYWKLMKDHPNPIGILRPKLTLDFGDAWILDQLIEMSKLKSVLCAAYPEDHDTLLSLIAFKLLDNAANCYAGNWQEGSFNRLLHPNAVLQSQRLSDFMESLGAEENSRRFFESYFAYLNTLPGTSDNMLQDSTGLPNEIHLPLSALNNHNGVYSREVRLIFVVDRASGYPVYFRCVAGNIVDVSTLAATIAELKAQGAQVSHGIFDAGYYSETNIVELFKSDIPFMMRLPDNRKLFAEVLESHRQGLEAEQNLLKYSGRLIFMKRVSKMMFEYDGYVYIAVDLDRKNDEQHKFYDGIAEKGIDPEDDVQRKLERMGVFMLVSSEKLETKDVLPLYYNRETIEQIFDMAKNEIALLPLRSHKLETFRGHILLSFLATVLYVTINRIIKEASKPKRKKQGAPEIKNTKFCAKSVFHALRTVKCNVYDGKLITNEPTKNANKILDLLKLKIPVELSL
jgi:hypothetical protein